MKPGVEGKSGAGGQVITLLRPRNPFAGSAVEPTFGGIEPNAHGRLGFESARETGEVIAEQPAGSLDKRGRQIRHNGFGFFAIRQN